jgi:hypothetical protein
MLKNRDNTIGIFLKDQDGMIAATPMPLTSVGIDNIMGVFDASSLTDSIFKTNDGAISALGGAAGPTSENRILLGQFTTKGQFSFELNIQIGTPTPGVSEKYVASNPKNGELTIPSLIYKSPSNTTTPVDPTKASLSLIENHSISTFPNPCSDKLFVKFDNNTSGKYNLELLSADGKLVTNKVLDANSELNVVDLTTYNKGVYFVRISNQNSIYNQRIIID